MQWRLFAAQRREKEMENNLKKLEQTIGYQFTAKSLLEQAMTHSSYANEKHLGKLGCNERLEFLGDAVLELISSDFLYKKFRNNQEGELTKKRASMVCEKSLAYCAREFGLPEFILLGRGEEMMGGRKRDSIVSDALESLIGAMYLDGGFEPAQTFVLKFILNDLEDKRIFYDSKTVLQEMVQEGGNHPVEYRLLKEEGPDHSKSFTVEALINGESMGTIPRKRQSRPQPLRRSVGSNKQQVSNVSEKYRGAGIQILCTENQF